jgi:hypothetical protein
MQNGRAGYLLDSANISPIQVPSLFVEFPSIAADPSLYDAGVPQPGAACLFIGPAIVFSGLGSSIPDAALAKSGAEFLDAGAA